MLDTGCFVTYVYDIGIEQYMYSDLRKKFRGKGARFQSQKVSTFSAFARNF